MDKIKEENLEKLREIKQNAENDLKNEPGNEKNVVQNVKTYGIATLIRRDNGEKEQFEVSTVETYDYETDEIKTKIYLNGEKADMQQLIRDYKDFKPITDLIENLNREEEIQGTKGKEKNKEKNKEKIYDLNELEAEKEMEEYAKVAGVDPKKVKRVTEIKEKEQEVDENKLENVNHLQEIDANTKVNNHEDLEQAFGMKGVRKFVVIYSEDTETIAKNNEKKMERNNTRYSMIAIMDDGKAVNIDDKLEQSRSEGTNSTEGRIQTDADGTTKKEYHAASVYNIKGKDKAISIENDNYGEMQIYYGAMTKGAYGNDSNQFVGTQLETNNVWPTSKDVREQECNREGMYHADEKAKEVNKHLEHGDEKIENIENADGNENTVELCNTEIIPGTNPEMKWEELSEITGEGIQKLQERFERELEKGKNDSNEIVEEIEEDYGMITKEHNHN